ncbi:MAG TPA: phosphate ABC transporter substrate-binding protein [Methanothrix sp.]|nr:phosphate ABC transporter substrate-binding protein [Methanothrix sp.]
MIEPERSTKFGLLTAVLLIVVASGCAEERDRENLVVTGSTTVLPAVERCAEVFNQVQDEIGVQVSSGGSGRGIQDVASGLADIGMASREVKESEISQFGDRFTEHLIGYDAIAVVVSREIYDAGVRDLSSEEVSEIYSGKIKSWRDLGGPEVMILPVARVPGSGTGDTFNEMIMGSTRAETEGVEVNAMENAEIKTLIVQSDKAIGYLGIGYARTGNLGAVALDGVSPTEENIKNQTYKLSRPLYLYTWDGTSEEEAEFINFVIGPEGQRIMEEEGFFSAAAPGPDGRG